MKHTDINCVVKLPCFFQSLEIMFACDEGHITYNEPERIILECFKLYIHLNCVPNKSLQPNRNNIQATVNNVYLVYLRTSLSPAFCAH